MYFHKHAGAEDYALRCARLLIPFSITFNATPASKVTAVDLAGVAVLATEGQTAAAAAVDSGTNFTTPVDATGIFGVLLANLGTVEKLLDAQILQLSSGTATISKKGASSSGVTASGNIAVSIDSSLDLSAVSLSAVLAVDYRIAHN